MVRPEVFGGPEDSLCTFTPSHRKVYYILPDSARWVPVFPIGMRFVHPHSSLYLAGCPMFFHILVPSGWPVIQLFAR